MSEERVQCIECHRNPLVATAKKNDGRCGVCQRSFEYKQREEKRSKERAHYLKNPPRSLEEIEQILKEQESDGKFNELALRNLLDSIRIPPFDPKKFSRRDFDREIVEIVEKYHDDLGKLYGEFLYLCELVVHSGRIKRISMRKLPTPIRELYALSCAHGSIGSDSFDSYIESYGKYWDDDCESAIDLFQTGQERGSLQRAREAYKKDGTTVPAEIADELEDAWYEPIREFEEKVLAPALRRYGDDVQTS